MEHIVEEWRPICGYEGLYQVSNLGRVKSLKNNKGIYREKILIIGKNKDGYLQINLCKEGKMKTFRVHRLVANAFIENPNEYTTVNHIDENKENNCVDNLEWMNLSQQQRHGTCIKRRVEKIDWKTKVANTDYKAIAEKQSKRVYQYDKNGKLVAIWESTRECGRNGYNQGNVAACCRGEAKSHRGYIWSYTPL